MAIATHEAGHAVIGYLHGHTTNYIDITLNSDKGIYPHTDKNFGADSLIIKSILEQDLDTLEQIQDSTIIAVAEKYCIRLLAGTFAEFWDSHNKLPPFEDINSSDRQTVIQCIKPLPLILKYKFDRNAFLNKCLNKTRDLVLDQQNLNKIKAVAELLMASNTSRITGDEIEKLLIV